MTNFVTVASRVPMALRLSADYVLHGSRHDSAVNGAGITTNVDADVLRAWLDTNAGHEAVVGGHIYEVRDEGAAPAAPVAAEPAAPVEQPAT